MELEREIKSLSRVMKNVRHPLVFILGGEKAGDKLGILRYFRRRADKFLLGGAPANTVLSLKGMDVKKSLRDTDGRNFKELKALLKYKNIVLPVDFTLRGGAILDIGTETTHAFGDIIGKAKTIVWNGPVGLIEKKPFNRGTLAVARMITGNKKAFSIVGGGETVMFLKKYGLDKKFSFVSTGGGALFKFLAGEKLPGITALEI